MFFSSSVMKSSSSSCLSGKIFPVLVVKANLFVFLFVIFAYPILSTFWFHVVLSSSQLNMHPSSSSFALIELNTSLF